MVKILLIAFFKCKSDAAVYQLEGTRAEDSTFSIPTFENTFQNPFFKHSVVSQLLYRSSQILTLTFREISTTLNVYVTSVLTCRFYLWKKSSNFFPFHNICDDMTRDLWVGSICNHYRGAALEGPQSCFHLQWRIEPVPGNSLVIWIITLNKTYCSTLISRLITYAFRKHSTHFRNFHNIALNENMYLRFTFPSLTSCHFMSVLQLFLTACFFQDFCKGTLVICSFSPLLYVASSCYCLKKPNFLFWKDSVAYFPDID